MRLYWNRHVAFIALAIVILSCNRTSTAAQKPATFVMTVYLPTPTMHVGEDLVAKATTSNPTDPLFTRVLGLAAALRWNS